MVDQTYLGTAYGTQDEPYEKVQLLMRWREANLNKNTLGGYVSFIQHYFVSAWVPKQDINNTIYTSLRNNQGIIGAKGEPVNIQANSEAKLSAIYYMGPKDTNALEALHEDLDLTVDLWLVMVYFSTFTCIA